MGEIRENTFTAYLGPEYQQRLIWQLLVEPDFAEKVINELAIEYFDDQNLKRLFIIILEFYIEFKKVPNLQNESIYQAINKYKTPNNIIEEESLYASLERIVLWNKRVLNKELFYDGDIVQKEAFNFIKQQEYRKLGELILEKTKTGDIKSKNTIGVIEDYIQKISRIGDDEDYGIDVFHDIKHVLRKEFREPVATGINIIDTVTGGGLGKSEFALILSPSGVGKTTMLTKIANTAYEEGKNVLQIIFEDTPEQIQRKHFTIWSGVPLNEIDDNGEFVERLVNEKGTQLEQRGGKLIIKRFNQENTTIVDIKNWIIKYQKLSGIKFNLIVLDYLDCLESHKKTADRNEAELIIVKSFEAMAAQFNIPCWSAIQSNRSGFDSELVEAFQTGGSIKRVQKAHFFMSIAKTPSQKESSLANIRIIKARFAQDGQTFKDCIFNNNTMEISINSNSNFVKLKDVKLYDDDDREKLLEKWKKEYRTTELDIQTEIISKKFEENKINYAEFSADFEKNDDNNFNTSLIDATQKNINKNDDNFELDVTKNIVPTGNTIENEINLPEKRDDILELIVEKDAKLVSSGDMGIPEIKQEPPFQSQFKTPHDLLKNLRDNKKI